MPGACWSAVSALFREPLLQPLAIAAGAPPTTRPAPATPAAVMNFPRESRFSSAGSPSCPSGGIARPSSLPLLIPAPSVDEHDDSHAVRRCGLRRGVTKCATDPNTRGGATYIRLPGSCLRAFDSPVARVLRSAPPCSEQWNARVAEAGRQARQPPRHDRESPSRPDRQRRASAGLQAAGTPRSGRGARGQRRLDARGDQHADLERADRDPGGPRDLCRRVAAAGRPTAPRRSAAPPGGGRADRGETRDRGPARGARGRAGDAGAGRGASLRDGAHGGGRREPLRLPRGGRRLPSRARRGCGQPVPPAGDGRHPRAAATGHGARRRGGDPPLRDLRPSVESHRRLLEAIADGDPARAAEVADEIVSRNQKFVLGLYALGHSTEAAGG